MNEHPVALVTGGSGGIGKAICEALAARGAYIAVHFYSSAEKAGAFVSSLQEKGVNAAAFRCDLRSDTDVKAMLSAVESHFGRLDLLINNAGWSRLVPPSKLDDLTDEVIQETLTLKIQAPIYLIRAAAPLLKQSGRGSVVNITSAAGFAARGSSIVYAAANAALYNLTRSFARILSPEVRVNAVAPGYVETGFVFPADGKMAAIAAGQNYTGRAVTPAEIATAVTFLCFDAPSVTGEELIVDGGIARLWKKG